MSEDRSATTDNVAVVIVAAGRGERAGQSCEGPKQFRRVGGKAVIARTIEAFAGHPSIASLVVALHPDDRELFDGAVEVRPANLTTVDGGASRQDSVRLALHALIGIRPDSVLIHDGVRPFVDIALIDRVIAAVGPDNGALPTLAVSDTLKRVGADGTVLETIARADLHAAQTPQGFPFGAMLAAHDKAHAQNRHDFTDDAAIAEWVGLPVTMVGGSPDNVKLTWARDIELADRHLSDMDSAFPDVRTGNGYDVHAFGPGDRVTLGGVDIANARGLSGHSDADVALHALTDALLATCSAGDIGTHFPPSDPQWRGAASNIFVRHAVQLVRGRGGRIANADITLICENPKIGPHRAAMTNAIATMLEIDPGRVSIKATTNEKLGFVGREEGIAAIATVSVIYPGGVPA